MALAETKGLSHSEFNAPSDFTSHFVLLSSEDASERTHGSAAHCGKGEAISTERSQF